MMKPIEFVHVLTIFFGKSRILTCMLALGEYLFLKIIQLVLAAVSDSLL